MLLKNWMERVSLLLKENFWTFATGLASIFFWIPQLLSIIFLLKSRNTNDDGRLLNLLTKEEFKTGYYKITFDTEAYFRAKDLSTFYPYVEVNYYYNLNDACNKLYCCKFSYCYLLLQTNKISLYIITRHIHDMSFLN